MQSNAISDLGRGKSVTVAGEGLLSIAVSGFWVPSFSLQVPDVLQQRTGGGIPEPVLRVSVGPGMAILLLSLQQEVPIFLLVSLRVKSNLWRPMMLELAECS